MSARSVHPPAGLARLMHALHADFCKHLIADSYRNPSVFHCAELQLFDLIHHQRLRCPLIKQDRWTAAMESQLGYLSSRMVGEEAS